MILTLAFTGRVVYGFVAQTRLNGLVISDMRTYDLLAKNLIEENIYGFREGPWRSYRPPLYPFFLSIVYRVAGYRFIAVRIIQAALAVLSSLLLYLLARELAGTAIALVASFFFAADFSLIHLSGLLLSENLYLPLSLVVLLLLERGYSGRQWAPFIGAGVAGGLAALCRPTILPFLFLSFLVPITGALAAPLPGRDRDTVCPVPGSALPRRRLKPATTNQSGIKQAQTLKRGLAGWLLMLLFAAATIAPWTARNWRIHHAFVPISTNAGSMLWMGLHHGANGGYDWPRENNPLLAISSEVERNRIGIRESITFIFNHPGEFARLAVIKMKLFWRGYLFTWSGRQWAVIGLCGLAGLLLSLKDWRTWLLLYLYLLSFTGIHLFVHSSYRYRLPLNPLLEIWAAFFLVRLGSMIRAALSYRR